MEENTVLRDIAPAYGNPDVQALGTDYEGLTGEMYFRYDQLKNDETRETYLAVLILQQWRQTDINKRKKIVDELNTQGLSVPAEWGWGPDNLEAGLDYENQENQILYARMHAAVIIELVERKIEEDEDKQEEGKTDFREFSDILQDKAQEMQTRETARKLAEAQAGEVVNAEDTGSATPEDTPYIPAGRVIPAMPPKEDAPEIPQEPEAPKEPEIQLPPEDSDEYKRMKVETYVNDLYKNLEKGETLERGIDYAKIGDELLKRYDEFASDKERVDFLVGEIMKAWTEADVQTELAKGERSEEEIRAGYAQRDNEPEHKAFAKMHADAMFSLVGEVKKLEALGNTHHRSDYIQLLDGMIERDDDLKEALLDQVRKGIIEVDAL
jgi:hypothetical protein